MNPRKTSFANICRLAGWLAGWLAGRNTIIASSLIYLGSKNSIVILNIGVEPSSIRQQNCIESFASQVVCAVVQHNLTKCKDWN